MYSAFFPFPFPFFVPPPRPPTVAVAPPVPPLFLPQSAPPAPPLGRALAEHAQSIWVAQAALVEPRAMLLGC